MKKEVRSLIIGLIAAMCMLVSVGRAQAPCTQTICGGSFDNYDLQRIFQAITAQGGGTTIITGTVPVRDNSVDTLTNRLLWIWNSQYYGGFSTASLLNSAVNYLASISSALSGTLLVEVTNPITGSVSVTNFPTSQNINGTVSIANFPSTQSVSVVGNVTVDVQPPGAAAVNSYSLASVTAYTNNLVAKASAGAFYGVSGYNSSASGIFIQIHNKASLPSNGTVPLIIFYVAPLSSFSFNTGLYPNYFSTGITVVSSTTGPTLTLTDITTWFNINYL